MNGDYITTEFYVNGDWGKKFYSNDDFKIAMVFRDKMTNEVIDHNKIKEYADTYVFEVSGDTSTYYE